MCGFLNFLCRCIVPGRVFLHGLYSHVLPKLKPHHHLKITGEMKMDLQMWQQFLLHPSIFCRPFADFKTSNTAVEINLYTDAVKSANCGAGGVCHNQWFFVGWTQKFLIQKDPSIEYLELYAVTAGVLLLLHKYPDHKIVLFCNNQSVVTMINSNTSSCRNCMLLLRIIVLHSLKTNTLVRAKYVKSKLNSRADAISRRRFDLFK